MCDTLLSPTPLHMHSSYLLYALKLEAQLREVRARPTTPLHYSSCGLSLTFSLSYSPIITRLTHSDTQLGRPHTPPMRLLSTTRRPAKTLRCVFRLTTTN